MIQLIASPWNVVLAACVWSTIQTLKSMIPALRDGGRWHYTLRMQCVVACVIAYQVPGPWVPVDTTTTVKVIVGLVLGTVTTVAHGLVSDIRRALMRSRDPNKDFNVALENVKKFGGIVAAAIAGVSGIYGAWFRPETKARSSYEVLSEAVETVSHDVDGVDKRVSQLADAHNALDRQSSIEIALLKKHIEALEAELHREHAGYQVPKKISVSADDLSLSGQILEPADFQMDSSTSLDVDDVVEHDSVVVDSINVRSRIKRDGKRLELPGSGEMFK